MASANLVNKIAKLGSSSSVVTNDIVIDMLALNASKVISYICLGIDGCLWRENKVKENPTANTIISYLLLASWTELTTSYERMLMNRYSYEHLTHFVDDFLNGGKREGQYALKKSHDFINVWYNAGKQGCFPIRYSRSGVSQLMGQRLADCILDREWETSDPYNDYTNTDVHVVNLTVVDTTADTGDAVDMIDPLDTLQLPR